MFGGSHAELARSRLAVRWAALLAMSTATVCGLVAARAWAADQFTIDRNPDSFGAVVTDQAGNGYVAWEHAGSGGAADVPMFCKLAPGVRRCAHPTRLALPGSGQGAQANALALFPILGPGQAVWVVTSRYVLDDTLIWTSGDGGRSFGAPAEIPYTPNCPPSGPCPLSYSYAGLTQIDDGLPIALNYATYDRQVYLTGTGLPSVYWLESSNNPGLGFNIDDTAEISGGSAGTSEFTFDNPGGGGVGGSALGTTSVGEVVEAYWLDTTPPKLAYYYFHEPPKPVPISPQSGWAGPVTLGAGYLPRLADGTGGLFLLSSDSIHGAGQPTAVDVRSYSTATHTFGPASTLARTGAGIADLFRGGGLAENYDTGELAAVWPRFSNTGTQFMRLWLSTHGEKRFSAAQYIATVGDSYSDFDNARVAIADHGTGFVTFEDAGGLEVADLYPLGAQWQTLRRTPSVVKVPVSCPAPKGHCKVTVTLAREPAGKLASGHSEIGAGATSTLRVPLAAAALSLLASHHGPLRATLTIVLQPPSTSPHTTKTTVELRG
jgi:hypothetical protein